MGPPSYVQSVVDRNVVMRRILRSISVCGKVTVSVAPRPTLINTGRQLEGPCSVTKNRPTPKETS